MEKLLVFYSTLAQSLAAIVALFSFFTLYRIQSLHSELLGIGNAYLEEYERDKSLWNMLPDNLKPVLRSRIIKAIFKGNIDELETHLTQFVENINTESFKTQLQQFIEKKGQLIFLKKYTVLISGLIFFLMGLCFFTIILSDTLVLSNVTLYYLPLSMLIFGLGLISYLLVKIIRICFSV